MRRRWLLGLAALVFLIPIRCANANVTYHLGVGAYGEAASIGNWGVQAEIRTHIYHVNAPDASDSFWVGDYLDNGAFVQFGYELLHAGSYCNYAEAPLICLGNYEEVNGSEADWFWQYILNATGNLHYYYQSGRAGLAGVNGSWHEYRIVPNSEDRWSFQLDRQQVASMNFTAVRSSDRVIVVAEKTYVFNESVQSAESPKPGPLGPVEFRNVAYLMQDGWHQVTSLSAIVNCGVNQHCIPIPYGVSILGPNHIIVGSSVAQPSNGELLWSTSSQGILQQVSQLTSLENTIFFLIERTILAVVILVAVFALRKSGRFGQKPPDASKEVCASCGVRLDPNARFCSSCGAPRSTLLRK